MMDIPGEDRSRGCESRHPVRRNLPRVRSLLTRNAAGSAFASHRSTLRPTCRAEIRANALIAPIG
jgi:hypothetical protein